MPECCSVDTCGEAATARLEDRPVCRSHFLALSYSRLEAISAQIHLPEFHSTIGRSAGGFLEDCMRQVADIACAPVALDNMERAQVLDILLWASELHSRLRRGPRMQAGISILLRSEGPEQAWEEKTETRELSRHGLLVHCSHELSAEQLLTCIRLDNGWKAEARVVWVRRKTADGFEAGLEFLTDENFWGLELDDTGASGEA